VSTPRHVLRWSKERDKEGVYYAAKLDAAFLMLITEAATALSEKRTFTLLFSDLAFQTKITDVRAAKEYAEKTLGAYMTRFGEGLATLSAAKTAATKEAA